MMGSVIPFTLCTWGDTKDWRAPPFSHKSRAGTLKGPVYVKPSRVSSWGSPGAYILEAGVHLHSQA